MSFADGSEENTPSESVAFVVNADVTRRWLTTLAPVVHLDPVAPHPVALGFKSSGQAGDRSGPHPVPAVIVPPRPGENLDIDTSADAIKQAIENDPATSTVPLEIRHIPAPGSVRALQGIDSRIGYFVTHFNPGEVGRTQTVRRAIDIINGTILKPGQIFSVNGTVGERTAERGFGEGFTFVNGKLKVQLGGGMCQVATTLFNAAMLADLKIVQRFPHVRTVPYVEPGRDATVYWGAKDFKFQNDTPAPIYISYHTTRSHAIVALFGKGVPGRVVLLIHHHKRLGERHFTGIFSRVVHEPDGAAHRDRTYYSDYTWTPALDYNN